MLTLFLQDSSNCEWGRTMLPSRAAFLKVFIPKSGLQLAKEWGKGEEEGRKGVEMKDD